MVNRSRLSFGGIDMLRPGVGPTMGASQSNVQSGGGGGRGSVQQAEAGSDAMPEGNPTMAWVGMLGLIVLLAVVRKQSSHLQANVLGINVFNTLTVTIIAIVGITLFKVIFTKFAIPGVSQVIQAV